MVEHLLKMYRNKKKLSFKWISNRNHKTMYFNTHLPEAQNWTHHLYVYLELAISQKHLQGRCLDESWNITWTSQYLEVLSISYKSPFWSIQLIWSNVCAWLKWLSTVRTTLLEMELISEPNSSSAASGGSEENRWRLSSSGPAISISQLTHRVLRTQPLDGRTFCFVSVSSAIDPLHQWWKTCPRLFRLVLSWLWLSGL